ncbi:MAG: hypothetical protein P1U41_06835 [Vicingaceae bacterium]|nr:hypothetical protein [Vicingaceae bacterium]
MKNTINNSESLFYLDKELIEHLKFPSEDIIDCKNEKKERETQLKKSVRLGNHYKQKVKIYFKDFNLNLCVETTIWHVGQKYINLKGGVSLPVRRIYKVEI